jgi:hypothetical protein
MSDQTVSYDLETDVPQTYFGKLIEFMYKRYLVPKAGNVKDIQKDSSDKNPSLSFTITGPANHTTVRAHVTTDRKVHLKLVPLEEAGSEGAIARLKEDIEIVVDYSEESVQAHALFFAWREGETVVPEKVSEKGKGSINRRARYVGLLKKLVPPYQPQKSEMKCALEQVVLEEGV